MSQLVSLLRDILVERPAGLSEYDLLKLLREQSSLFVADPDPALQLFQQHFLLFHALYRLQTERIACGESLLISPLKIQLMPNSADRSAQAVAEHDPLRDYYLDLDQLSQTGEPEVQDLLDNFWNHLSRRERRAEALAVLGLQDPVDDQSIRLRYRRLIMTHHPDRGGQTRQIQYLNAAIGELLPKHK